jgi:creatinine amidohydrolase
MPTAGGFGMPNTDAVHRLADMTWQEVEAAVEDTQTMLLPVGSTEQHVHHVPLGVDVYLPEAISERVAERTGCLLAPSVWNGVSPRHTFKPGTFTVESETFQHSVRDVCVSAAEWGSRTSSS